MCICIICGSTTINSKYCSNCKSIKDRCYSALNRGKKKLSKLLNHEKYSTYRFVKLEGTVKDMKSDRETLLTYIEKDGELLKEKAAR